MRIVQDWNDLQEDLKNWKEVGFPTKGEQPQPQVIQALDDLIEFYKAGRADIMNPDQYGPDGKGGFTISQETGLSKTVTNINPDGYLHLDLYTNSILVNTVKIKYNIKAM